MLISIGCLFFGTLTMLKLEEQSGFDGHLTCEQNISLNTESNHSCSGNEAGVTLEEKNEAHQVLQIKLDHGCVKQNKVLSRIEKEEKLFHDHRAITSEKWKKILRNERVDTLHEEGEFLRQFYRDEIERKDEFIGKLMNSCEISENQSRLAFSSYMQKIQMLLESFECQMQAAEENFRTAVQQMTEDYQKDCVFIKERANEHVREYEETIKLIEQREQSDMAQQTINCQNIIEDIHERGLQDMQSLRSTLDRKIEDLEDQLASTYTEYLSKTDCTSEELKLLVSQGNDLSSDINSIKDMIHGLKRSIRNLKAHSDIDSSRCLEQSCIVMNRKNQAKQLYDIKKDALTTSRQDQLQKLKYLAIEAHTYKSKLSKRLDMLERIVQRANFCFPLQEDRYSVKNPCDCAHSLTEFIDDATLSVNASNIIQMFDHLDVFWKKYNTVKNDLNVSKEEETRLLQKKNYLKKQLKKYRDGLTINNNVMSRPNPLFVINGQMGKEYRYLTNSFAGQSDNQSMNHRHRRRS